jgi:hypothetical protein
MASRKALVFSGDRPTNDRSIDRVIERNMKICAKPTLWRANVIARSREVARDNWLLLRQGVDRVG